MNQHTLSAALRAAGAAVLATDLVMKGEGAERVLQRASSRAPRVPRTADGFLHLQ
jgi:hypothetical protein